MAINSEMMDEGGRKFEKEVIVVDTKRKRIELENNKKSNIGEDIFVKNNISVEEPKNGLEAGSGYQSRLEQ